MVDSKDRKVPEEVYCSCGHNLTRGVYLVSRGTAATELFVRAYWGTMEREGNIATTGGTTACECPECGEAVSDIQAGVLGMTRYLGGAAE